MIYTVFEGQLVWGPLADHYGRTRILFLGLILYEAFTIACIFANSINTLIALRTIEGLSSKQSFPFNH